MNKRIIIDGSIILGTALLTIPTAAQTKKSKQVQQRPNVLFILADDLGYGDLSCYGQERFETPNIDNLALQGMRFTQCYSGTTVSAPSRASLLTGLHTGHTAVRGNKGAKPEGQFPLPENTYTIFHLFKQNGYATGAFGKWGLGNIGSTGEPDKMGIDNFFGYNCQSLAHNYYPDHLWDNNQKVDFPENLNGGHGTYSADLIHDKAIKFLDENKDKPFFLFYPTTIPHAELIVPEDSIIRKFRGLYPETPYHGNDSNERKGGYCSQVYPHATFAAMVYRLDVRVGQLVQKLKNLGLYDNTIIVFASDNGPHMEGGADPDFFNGNGIYRGIKRDVYEGGIRVPMIVSWPGHIKAGTQTDFMCSFWDMMPTFDELLKGKPIKNTDGISLLPLLESKKGQQLHDYLYFEFHEMNGRQAVRKGDWKLVHLNVSVPSLEKYELYNLASDPQEKHNIIGQYPEIEKEMKSIMVKAHVKDPNWPLLPSEKQ